MKWKTKNISSSLSLSLALLFRMTIEILRQKKERNEVVCRSEAILLSCWWVSRAKKNISTSRRVEEDECNV